MTTNLWVEQFWKDYKLQWDPEAVALADGVTEYST
jgi:hypothetical protein